MKTENGNMISIDMVLTKKSFEMIRDIYEGKEVVGCFVKDEMVVNILNEKEHKTQQLEEAIAFARSVENKTIGELSSKELEEILDNNIFMTDFLRDNIDTAEAALQSLRDDIND